MKIQRTENNNIPSFKTYLGLELQEKLLLAKSRSMLSREQLRNLTRIEDNGSNTVLDITKKILIKNFGTKKSSAEIKRILSLKNNTDAIEIDDLSHIYTPTPSGNQIAFNLHKFLRLFDDKFDLPSKIQQACEKLSDKAEQLLEH